jgi:hypothetical protein
MTPEAQIEHLAVTCMGQFAERMVEWMQYLVSEPYPPSSYPLDAPNKRSGDLQEGIHVVEVAQVGMVTRYVIESSVFYTAYLNAGTKHMIKRPFMDMAFDKMEEVAADSLQAGFDSGEVPPIT